MAEAIVQALPSLVADAALSIVSAPVAAAKGAYDVASTAVKGVDGLTGARDARKQQSKLMQDQADQQNRMLADAKSEQANRDSIASATEKQQAARARQRSLASQAQGRRGTILTGPLGGAGGGYKTVLGS